MFASVLRKGHTLLFIGLLALAACGPALSGPTGTGPPSASPSPSVASRGAGQVTDLVSLVDTLRAKGLTVEPAGSVSQPFFDVEGSLLQVQGADVQVFEFADADAARAAMATIGPDGNPATMMIDWVAAPHFYQAGRLIVLYVGDDAAVTQALNDALGAQVAGQ